MIDIDRNEDNWNTPQDREKTEDTVKAQIDLEVMGIIQELYTSMPNTQKQNMLPTSHTMSIRIRRFSVRL